MELLPLVLTIKIACITILILVIPALPLSYWLSIARGWVVNVVELCVALPLILPPTVLGFYMLIWFGEGAWAGDVLRTLGIQPIFSFEGVILASVVYNLPFMILPLVSGFRSIPQGIHEAARMCGHSSWRIVWSVLLPMMRSNIMVAMIMTMMHTIGEFGVVMMVGGNIPNETRVMSIALYDEVQALNYQQAHWYAGFLLVVSIVALLIVFRLYETRSTHGALYKHFTVLSRER